MCVAALAADAGARRCMCGRPRTWQEPVKIVGSELGDSFTKPWALQGRVSGPPATWRLAETGISAHMYDSNARTYAIMPAAFSSLASMHAAGGGLPRLL